MSPLEKSVRLLDDRVAESQANADVYTEKLNQAIEKGLVRLLEIIRYKYIQLQDAGSLRVDRALIQSVFGNALYLLPPSDRIVFIQIFEQLMLDSSRTGGAAAARVASILNGQTISPPDLKHLDRAEEATRRLYRHIEDFKDNVMAMTLVALQQEWSPSRLSDQVRTGAGRLKGHVSERLTRTESQTAFLAATGAVYELMSGDEQQYEMWVVSYSEGTCSYCLSRDGNVFKKGDAYIPAHTLCNCFTCPYQPRWDDKAFRRDRHADSLQRLREAGLQPNYGPTPFEKSLGLPAPKPIFPAMA